VKATSPEIDVELARHHRPGHSRVGDEEHVFVRCSDEVDLVQIAYRAVGPVASGNPRIGGLALIAPPLGMYDFAGIEGVRAPTLMVAGTNDSYCPATDFARLGGRLPSATLVSIEGADHFFFGKLFPLGEAVAKWAQGLRRERPGP